jgi:hypothetical protein
MASSIPKANQHKTLGVGISQWVEHQFLASFAFEGLLDEGCAHAWESTLQMRCRAGRLSLR